MADDVTNEAIDDMADAAPGAVRVVPTGDEHLEGLTRTVDAVAGERLGFAREGVKRRARKLDGAYDDNVQMAILLDPETP